VRPCTKIRLRVGNVSRFLLYRTVRAESVEASRDGQSATINLLNDAVLPVVQQLQPRREDLCQAEWLGINHVIVEYLSRRAAYMRFAR
jgi:hypothetical protein